MKYSDLHNKGDLTTSRTVFMYNIMFRREQRTPQIIEILFYFTAVVNTSISTTRAVFKTCLYGEVDQIAYTTYITQIGMFILAFAHLIELL